MRILITGSNGMTGQAIIREALKFPELYIIATSSSPNRNPSVSNFELLDITYSEKINYLLDLYKPDCVINTAAISQVDICEQNRNLCYNINFKAVKKLADACNLRNIHFIHLSSDFVFDGQKHLPYYEDDNPAPVNYYGECKLMAEKYLLENSGLNCIVRTVLVYDYPKNLKRNNIFRWIYDSLQNGESIELVDDQFRTPTFANNLATALLKLAEKKSEGIFHICGEETFSVYEFGLKIAEHFNLDKSLIKAVSSASLNQVARRPQKTCLSIDRAIIETGYSPDNIFTAFGVIKTRIIK